MSERRYRIDKGDWVVPRSRYNSLGALAKPGKVIDADADSVTVSFHYDGVTETLEMFTTDEQLAGLMRIRWTRQRGRNRWCPA